MLLIEIAKLEADLSSLLFKFIKCDDINQAGHTIFGLLNFYLSLNLGDKPLAELILVVLQ